MIVTCTLNAAIDRTLTVPNFQRGQRHRASDGVTLAGGKGINVARALKALGVPVVATGLIGGSTGTRIVEQLTDEAIPDDFYAEAARDLTRRHVPVVIDSEGEPMRLGVEAEPFLVSPNQSEAEALVGQEFHDEEDFRLALDSIAEIGARNVLITTEDGCVALLREEREIRRLRAVAPKVEPLSTVGSGDVLLAGYLAARHAGRSAEESLRAAVAAGAASTLEV